ncbi:MAG TPA: serine/threonine protein kinase, partial [Actinotalea sp.]|nr:serine/threonine protein kinase [Actinotalea sp.]
VVGTLAALVVVAGVVVAAVLAFGAPAPPGSSSTPTPTPTATGLRAVPTPTDLVGTLVADGTAVFTWTNPDPMAGDRYLWGLAVPGVDPSLEVVDLPTVTLAPAAPGAEVCIEVSVVRADGRFSAQPAVGCVRP